MEVRDAEAEARAGLEAARGGVHADGGGCKRVVGWEGEGAPVLAAVVGCVRRASEDVVPFQDVFLGGVGDDVWWRGLGDGGIFLGEALGGAGGGHAAE